MTDQISGLENGRPNNLHASAYFLAPAILSVIFQVLHLPGIVILWTVIFWSCKFSDSIKLFICYIRGSAAFDEDVDTQSRDSQSREYREDDYSNDGVPSKYSSVRTSAPSKASIQWPERGQATASQKKVIN